MADRRDLADVPDDELELALRDVGRSLAWPAPTGTDAPTADDAAARTRRRIVAEGIRPAARPGWIRAPGRRPLRTSLLIAAAAVLLIAALAAAIGLGLPGIRITFTSSPQPSPTPASSQPASGEPSASSSPAPSGGALGWQLGLGGLIAADEAGASVDFAVRRPASLGAPSSAWLLDGRLSTVWPTSAALPPLEQRDLGLILTQFRGDVDAGYFDKMLRNGTTIQPVEVDGVTGYWISGDPHELIFVNPSGEPVFDSRRIVGRSLIWARSGITYRLETGLDREAAVALANTLR